MKSKANLIILGAILVLIVFTLPIGINEIMFWGDFNVAGDDKTWITFFGSYVGAIIGGIISGAMTLLGVLYTVKSQKRDSFFALYPEKRLIGDKITSEIEKSLDNIYHTIDEKNYSNLSAEILSLKNTVTKLLDESIKVSEKSYQSLFLINKQTESWLELIKSKEYPVKTLALNEIEYADNLSMIRNLLFLHKQEMRALINELYGYH